MYEANMNWDQRVAADAALSERVGFIRNTYLHVAGSLVALTVLLAALVNFVPDDVLRSIFARGGYVGSLIIFVGFIAVSYGARWMVQGHKPIATQYTGLALYTAALAFLLWPAIWVCTNVAKYDGVLGQAVILTLALAAGLTVSVMITKVDFSFLGSFLCVMSFILLGVLAAGAIFQFNFGLLLSVAMVVFLSLSILYTTSNIVHHYGTQEYVAAALEVFSAVVVLFTWILDIVMSTRD